MHRFFIAPEQISGQNAYIEGEDVKHITRVLRLQAGDQIVVCDGCSHEYTATIESANPNRVELRLNEKTQSLTEPAHRVTLYQSLPKTGKMETIIQKCTELGIAAIAPVVSERCVVRPEKDWENKRQRYQRVAYEAAKQSKRGVIPKVLPLQPLADCDFSQYDLVLFAYEEEREHMLKQALRDAHVEAAENIAMIIGPEGGFEESECAYLCAKGAVRVSLGSRILRTETAGMAMLAMVLYELEG